jgi:hypothetical protein
MVSSIETVQGPKHNITVSLISGKVRNLRQLSAIVREKSGEKAKAATDGA